MALIKEYFELTKKFQDEYGENTILLMQVGSFFEVYAKNNKNTNTISGSKINDFSQICELNVVEKNVCVGTDDILMAGFKDMMIEKYLKKIQDAGFTAVVYTQDEAAKNTTRSCAGIFSPGTYFSTESQSLSNNITCIWIDLIENKVFMKGKYVVVGVANIDILTGKTSIFQFKEVYLNNPTTYDELERFISIYNPSEVIFISNLPDENEMDYIISYAGIQCNLIHKICTTSDTQLQTQKVIRVKNCEKQTYQKEILNKFYQIKDFDVFYQNFYNNNIAAQAFCYLLDFVYQHNPYLVNKISEPIFENCSERLILANHSLKQLNIIDDSNYNGKYSSVLKMLNNCLTPMGNRKFAYNFLNPTTNIEYLQREYNITEYFMTYLSDEKYNNFIRSNLSCIKDISKNERQIFIKKISPKSFYTVYNNILLISKIYDKISEDSYLMDYLTVFEKNILNIKGYCDELTSFIVKNINLELAKDIDQLQNFESNFIQKDVNNELDNKTYSLKESELKLETIREYLSGIIENKEKKGKSADYVKIHETEKNNCSLICTSRRCKLLEDALPSSNTVVKLSFDISNNKKTFDFNVSKKQFSFTKQTSSNNSIDDEQINGLCKNIYSIKISMKDLVLFVFNKFVASFEVYQEKLESIINFITLVDMLYAKGTIAKKYNYCKPNIVQADKSFIDAKNLRHCLIEHLQNNELYVTNDIILGDGKNDGLLLYGTNAVGKTSLIRALGISLIMAQSGLFVPCSSFDYFPYKYIFTRILGNDNIFKGLSTFAVEMSELRTILRLADKNSLILGDELCSGTENTSAISIFVAGIQKLHECNSSFIFATHLHEIVNYEEITSLASVALKHMSVVYDKEKDMLIYDRKLRDGPGNNLYGLEVCKSLSLPNDFLEAAYNIRMKYNPESSSLLSLKTSRYNSKKIVGICEKCGKNMGTEVHHLQHQAEADSNGFISNTDSVFHKNNLANLMTLCDACHDEEHKVSKKGSKRVKTTKGNKISEIK
jgi:DNA mismatch repair protein MutS